MTYKTAWRIGYELRKYMGFVDGDRTLGGMGLCFGKQSAWTGPKAKTEAQ